MPSFEYFSLPQEIVTSHNEPERVVERVYVKEAPNGVLSKLDYTAKHGKIVTQILNMIRPMIMEWKAANKVSEATYEADAFRLEASAIWTAPGQITIYQPLMSPSALEPCVFCHVGRDDPKMESERHKVDWRSDKLLVVEDDMTMRIHKGYIDFIYMRFEAKAHLENES